MGYKLCPKCELNYIKDEEDLCDVCKEQSGIKVENSFIKNNKRNSVIKSGEGFPFCRNYELINYLTGSNLKNWYKATYTLTSTYYMWIISLDGVERYGWKDVLLNDGRIKENFVGDRANTPSNLRKTFDYSYKAVFEKFEDYFIFKGVYKLDVKNSSLFERFYLKVSDETTLFDF